MKEIGETFREEGGLEMGKEMFEGVAGVYGFVSGETVLGEERVEGRKRGRTVEDVGAAVAEGVRRKRRKGSGNDAGVGGEVGTPGEEDLKLAWRGSWS